MGKEFARPTDLQGRTFKVRTGCGALYITINDNADGKPIEMFLRLGKAGGCASATAEATGRLVSRLLQIGDSPINIIKQLKGISCHSSSDEKPSCVNAAAKALTDLIGGG
jgi:ribonucleoside-diphosphate reductase alpha chain